MPENKQYNKPARAFEILNIGNYELEYLNDKPFDYLVFMLKLYLAEPVTGFRHIHGKKGIRLIHIGSLNAPVSMEEVRNTVKEGIDNKITKLDILGWEWSYEVNDLGKQYYPDYIVELKDGEFYFVETKGLVDIDVPRKDERAEKWCEDLTKLTENEWRFIRVNQSLFEGHDFKSFEELVKSHNQT